MNSAKNKQFSDPERIHLYYEKYSWFQMSFSSASFWIVENVIVFVDICFWCGKNIVLVKSKRIKNKIRKNILKSELRFEVLERLWVEPRNEFENSDSFKSSTNDIWIFLLTKPLGCFCKSKTHSWKLTR